jgi:signal transduction histidine kinase
MSLRTRLALFLALAVGLALLVQGSLSYLAFKGLLEGELDRSLFLYVHALSEGRRFPRGEFAFRLTGEVRQESANFPPLPDLPPGAYWQEGWRVLVLEVPGGRLAVARYEPEAAAALARFRLALLALGAGLTLAFALLASRLAGTALRPLSRLTQVAQAVAASQDLSLRVPLEGEGELRALAEAFNHMLERLEAFLERERRFTRDAAHELRTPVAAALAQVEAAEMGYLPKEEALEGVKEELLRMKRLVEALLLLAREGRVAQVPMDLAALAKEEAEALGVPYRGPEALPYQGDPLLLAQALRNLLANALLHGEGRGWRWPWRWGRRSSWRCGTRVRGCRRRPGRRRRGLSSGPRRSPGRGLASRWPPRWPRPTGGGWSYWITPLEASWPESASPWGLRRGKSHGGVLSGGASGPP